jgi:predicted RNA-binding Zn ribbon-like protein
MQNLGKNPVNTIRSVNQVTETLPYILRLPLIGIRPCLDFINTIAWRYCPEKRRDYLESYSDLLAFSLRLNLISVETYSALSERASVTPLAAERTLCDSRSFRDALTSLVEDVVAMQRNARYNQPRPEAIALFASVRRKAHEFESLKWKEGQLLLQPDQTGEGLNLPWLSLVRDAEALFFSPQASRVRVCAADGCGWAFLDLSKNASRRWCSMKLCGNQEKAARFKTKPN